MSESTGIWVHTDKPWELRNTVTGEILVNEDIEEWHSETVVDASPIEDQHQTENVRFKPLDEGHTKSVPLPPMESDTDLDS